MTKIIRCASLVTLVLGIGLALAGPASAVEFDPDACLDLSQIDVHIDGREYHYVPRPSAQPGACPEWVLVPKA